MKSVNAAAWVLACVLPLIAMSSPAKADVIFDWSLSGPAASLGGFPLDGSGTLTAVPSSGAAFTITGITGTLGGSTITGLTKFFVSDNLLFPNGTEPLDTGGLAFTTADGESVDIFSFFAEGSVPSGNAFGEETSGAGFGVGTFTATQAAALPEPASMAVFSIGLLGAAVIGRRRKSRQQG